MEDFEVMLITALEASLRKFREQGVEPTLAQFIESYAEKGRKIAIHGRLVKRTFLTKDGARRSVTEVEVKNFMGI